MKATELFVIELTGNQECYYAGTTLSGEVKIDLAYPLDVAGKWQLTEISFIVSFLSLPGCRSAQLQ